MMLGTLSSSVTDEITIVSLLVIGMTESVAVNTISSYGYTSRVTSRDGQNYFITPDFVSTRINLVINGTTVTDSGVG
jgi:uncharacterized protein YfdQ (DUF2303 family)